MIKKILYEDLKLVVHQTASEYLPDVDDYEVEGFVSAILTSFGLRAVHIALDASQKGLPVHVTEFDSRQGFDFLQLPRTSLVDQLDAASGLGHDICDSMIGKLEQLVASELKHTDQIQIDRLGTVSAYGSTGLQLLLDPELRVIAPGAGKSNAAFVH